MEFLKKTRLKGLSMWIISKKTFFSFFELLNCLCLYCHSNGRSCRQEHVGENGLMIRAQMSTKGENNSLILMQINLNR